MEFDEAQLIQNSTENWVIVSSKSGKHKAGYPIGEILCRSSKDVEQAIKDHNIHDPVIRPYVPEYGVKLTMEEVLLLEYSLSHIKNSLKLEQSEIERADKILYKLKNLDM